MKASLFLLIVYKFQSHGFSTVQAATLWILKLDTPIRCCFHLNAVPKQTICRKYSWLQVQICTMFAPLVKVGAKVMEQRLWLIDDLTEVHLFTGYRETLEKLLKNCTCISISTPIMLNEILP